MADLEKGINMLTDNITATCQHWRCEVDDDNIVWLYFDTQDSRVNVLNRDTLAELSQLVLSLATQSSIKGLVIASAKDNSFIMGADVHAIANIKDEQHAHQLITEGRQIFDNIAALPCITVAMINGFCLGGGLELALACDYRVINDDLKTKLALPEVLLGLYPGWGGSVRAVRLVGVLAAMNLMLTGRFIAPRYAKKIGLIDIVVPTRQLTRAAKATVLKPPKKQQPAIWLRWLNHINIRPWVGRLLTKQVAKKAKRSYYPAPFALVDAWVKCGVANDAFAHESETVSQLIVTSTCRHLLRVFHLRERLKGLAKARDIEPVAHVHVIGAGTMGGDIASVCALRGMTVTLQDTQIEPVAKAIGRAHRLFQRKLKSKRLTQAAMDRLIPDVNGYGIAKADLIIEAIIEDVAAKQALFKTVIENMAKDAILATNTSSIPLADIASALPTPTRLVGIHFFNPVPSMPLVEVVSDDKTDQRVLNRALAFVGQLDKLPLPTRSVPGFLVNRVLMPYLLESVKLLEAGYTADAIDQAACNFGMPMGPIELADKVGLDVCLSVARNLTHHYGGDVPAQLVQLVEQQRLGCKTNAGFYQYKSGKPVRQSNALTADKRDQIIKQLMGCLINESKRALADHVVDNADLVDAGMIFGTGFAPFRGGPLYYAATEEWQQLDATHANSAAASTIDLAPANYQLPK